MRVGAVRRQALRMVAVMLDKEHHERAVLNWMKEKGWKWEPDPYELEYWLTAIAIVVLVIVVVGIWAWPDVQAWINGDVVVGVK